MKQIAFLALALLLVLPNQAATVTGTFIDNSGTALNGGIVRFRPTSNPAVLNTNITGGIQKSVTLSTNGYYSTTLIQGNYTVTVNGYSFNISVPAGSDTYDQTSIATAVSTFPFTGLVRVTSTDTSPSYLTNKLTAGENITFTYTNVSGNAQLIISSDSSGSGLTEVEASALYQGTNTHLTDLSDGTLTGSKVGTGINADNVTSGTLAEARTHSDLARDSEVTSAIATHAALTDTLLEVETIFGVNLLTLTEGNAAYQPLDSDLTDIADLTLTSDLSVPDEAYGVGWNGSVEVPTKNALYDKIEALSLGGGDTDDQTAAEVPSTPAGGLAADDVQEALDELDTEKAPKASPTFTGTVTVPDNTIALGTKTTGNYAAGDAEAGAALTGDSATSFFSSGTLEDARIASTLTRDTEWDTIAEIETATSVNIIVSTEIDTEAEVETLSFGGGNVLKEADIDTQAEFEALLFTLPSGSGSGDVVGPGSATDNAIARFDSTTGKLIQNSAVTIDDSGNISTAGTISSGSGGGGSGTFISTEGTAPSLTANAFSIYSATDVAAGGLAYLLPAAAASGIMRASDSSGVMTISHDGGFSHLAGSLGDAQIAASAIDGGAGGEIEDGTITADDLGADSVSASELNATGVEAELEAVLDLNELQGTLGTGQAATGFTLDTEWDTIAEIETVLGVDIILKTEIDTEAEFESLLFVLPGGAGGLGSADIDTSAELRTIVGDESGTGALLFAGGDVGAATATTAAANDNDTSVATTAYVQTELTAYDTETRTLTTKTLAAGSNDFTGWPVEIGIAASDETTAITTGAGKVTFRAPFAFTLAAVRASVTTAPTGATILIDINEAGTTVISTKLMIDATEKTSTTATTPYVISDSAIADDAEITIDFDQVGSTISGVGVKVWLIGTRTI